MAAAGRLGMDQKFLALALWLCALASVWLLLSPDAFRRRAMAERRDKLEAEVADQRLRHGELQDRVEGLRGDPTAIEYEARQYGYGHAGERVYPLTDKELAANLPRASAAKGPSWTAAVRTTIAPILLGAMIVLALGMFLYDLRVEDPAMGRSGQGGKT